MSNPIITLTTDFGTDSAYVAQMKGVILSLNPQANIVDISHAVPAQDIRQGAMVLADVTGLFPADTIHVAVVDPGVGTARKIIYARIGEQHYIAPDNGLLSLVSKSQPPTSQIVLTNQEFWRENVSSTFHGRDIMAPVAAHLSLGVAPERFGESTDKLERISLPEIHIGTNEIKGSIVSFDSFGNLITDITENLLEPARACESLTIRCKSLVIRQLVDTYGSGVPQSLVALVGSSGMLELAIVNGNAAQRLGIELGENVVVTW